MISIGGAEIESHFTEYGVMLRGELTFITDDESEAKIAADLNDGKLVAREVFETAWTDAP